MGIRGIKASLYWIGEGIGHCSGGEMKWLCTSKINDETTVTLLPENNKNKCEKKNKKKCEKNYIFCLNLVLFSNYWQTRA